MNHGTGAKRLSTVLLRRLVPVRAVRMVRGPHEPAFHRTPLMGFVKDAPPPTSPGESTPERTVARSSVRCVPSRALVPSLPFHPTPTVSSSPCSAGLLHPAAGHGVRRVSMLAGGTEIPRDGCEASPRRRVPFEAFPSPVAVPRHRGRSLPVVRRGSTVFGTEVPNSPSPSPTSRSCSTDEAVANAPPLPAECCTLLPWASRSGTRSGPTRRSKEPRMLGLGRTRDQGFSFTHGRTRGPAATVADGANRLRRAEPATQTPESPHRRETSRHRSATRARGEDAARRPHLSAQRSRRPELPRESTSTARCCARVSQSVLDTRTVSRTSWWACPPAERPRG